MYPRGVIDPLRSRSLRMLSERVSQFDDNTYSVFANDLINPDILLLQTG